MFDRDRCTIIADAIRDSCKDVSFLCEVVIEEDDMNFLLENVMRICFGPRTETFCILTSYLLVHAGLSYDGDYWSHVDRMLSSNGGKLTQNNQKTLVDRFDEGIEYLGFDTNNVSTKRNIERILLHTVVPDNEKFLNNFFNFISTFYKNILRFDLPIDYSEAFVELSNIIHCDDERTLPADYPRPYALNQCTRYALKKPELYSKIMIKILNIIDAGYKGRPVGNLGNNRFATPFKTWFMNNIGNRSRRSLHNEMRLRRARMFLDNGNIKILIPVMNCSSDAKITIKRNKEVVSGPSMDIVPINFNGIPTFRLLRESVVNLNRLGVSPFEQFQIEFDGRNILTAHKRDYLFFDEDMVEIQAPTVGINYIVVKEKETIPFCESASIQKEDHDCQYIVEFKEGDVVSIGNDTITIYPSDSSENEDGVYVDHVDGVIAVDAQDNEYAVIEAFDVRCSLKEITPNSRTFVKVYVDCSLPIHIPLPVNENNTKNGKFYSKLPTIDLPVNDVHHFKIELYQSDVKKGETDFVLLPTHTHSFDCGKAYVDREIGIITRSGLVNDETEFKTSSEYVELGIPSNESFKIRYHVPAVRVATDDLEWRSPGDFDIVLNEFIGDRLHVMTPCKTTLFCNRKPLDYSLSNYPIYDLSIIRTEEYVKCPKNLILEISLSSTPRFHFMNIWACNEYRMEESEDAVEVSISRRVKNDITYELVGKTHITVIPDSDKTVIKKLPDSSFVFRIIETDIYGQSFLVNEQTFKREPIYFESIHGGCILYCKNEKIKLNCMVFDLKSIMSDYDAKSRFNPWMKRERAEVEKMFRANGIE